MPIQFNMINAEWACNKLDDGWQLNFIDPNTGMAFSILVSEQTALEIRRDLGGKPIEIATEMPS